MKTKSLQRFYSGKKGNSLHISGANMAVKALSLHSAVNYILAMAGAPVCASNEFHSAKAIYKYANLTLF